MIKDREIRKAIERQILAHKRKKKKAAYDKLEEFIYSKEKEIIKKLEKFKINDVNSKIFITVGNEEKCWGDLFPKKKIFKAITIYGIKFNDFYGEMQLLVIPDLRTGGIREFHIDDYGIFSDSSFMVYRSEDIFMYAEITKILEEIYEEYFKDLRGIFKKEITYENIELLLTKKEFVSDNSQFYWFYTLEGISRDDFERLTLGLYYIPIVDENSYPAEMVDYINLVYDFLCPFFKNKENFKKKYNHKMLFVKERREIEEEAQELYKQPKELKKIFELEKKIFKDYIVNELKKRNEFFKKEKESNDWWGEHYSELEKKRNSFLQKKQTKQLSLFQGIKQ